MARKSKSIRVYVAELGRSFDSYSVAAQELGIDASNIRKAATGKRPTAGGFHFIPYSKVSTIAKREEYVKSVSDNSRYAQSREEARRAARERQEMIREVHADLVWFNEMVRLSKKNTWKNPAHEYMFEKITPILGYNKRGGINTSETQLRKLSFDQLDEIQRYIHDADGGAVTDSEYERQVMKFARDFQIPEERIREIYDLVPLLIDTIEALRYEEFFTYQLYYERLRESVTNGLDRDYLHDLMNDIIAVYEGHSKAMLKDLLDQADLYAQEEFEKMAARRGYHF